jgi:hypothetical protein
MEINSLGSLDLNAQFKGPHCAMVNTGLSSTSIMFSTEGLTNWHMDNGNDFYRHNK